METVAVIGAGAMGSGIAQVAALQHHVILYDVDDAAAHAGLARVRESLEKGVARGKLAREAADAALARVTPVTTLDECAPATVVIEAAPEKLDLKCNIFRVLDALCAHDTLLGSNTSSLSITVIAGACRHPERVVGLHFFNPAPVLPLVEVVRGDRTSDAAVERALAFARGLGKTPVLARDTPAFIVNRVARPFYGEALRLLGEGGDVATIDGLLKSIGFPMGPFELMDLIGIDVNFAVSQSVYRAFFEEPRYRPHPIQQRMTEAGTLGRKTKRGFYSY
jgi:3-hydroxybutyryl-CoA dehydrogenase